MTRIRISVMAGVEVKLLSGLCRMFSDASVNAVWCVCMCGVMVCELGQSAIVGSSEQ